MSFENLRTTSTILLQFLHENGYSNSTIGAISREITSILENAETEGWVTYRDVYQAYVGNGWKAKSLENKRYTLRVIQRFDINGELPIRGQRSRVFESEKYENLPAAFKELVAFYREGELKRGMKATTLYMRTVNLMSFLHCLHERGRTSFNAITEKDVLSYFLSEDGRIIRGCTCKDSLTAVLKIGLGWKKEACERILAFLPDLRQSRKIIQHLTEKEIESVRHVLHPANSPLSCRNRAIGTLLLYTGLRGCDIAGLLLKNIDWKRDMLHITQQKTGVPLDLPLTAVAGNALFDYLGSERPNSCDEHVFLSEVPLYRPLAAGSLGKVLDHIFTAAGIRQKLGDRKGTHLFRHHAASHMLANGITKPVISKVLGHTVADSLNPYLMADFPHLKECALSIEPFPIPEEVLPL